MDLAFIAAHLEGLEETIISKLIDRAQFKVNAIIYKPGHSGFSGEEDSCLLEIRMKYQESMDAQFGRFCVPEERAFTKELPVAQRTVHVPDTGLAIDDYDKINLSADIYTRYLELITQLCKNGDDGHYGSSVEHDVYALQAIARRIHFGSLYVAESKYRKSPQEYRNLIEQGATDAILEKLTRQDVENHIISRIHKKVIAAQSTVNRLIRNVIDPDVVAHFYRSTIIPLTKKGEILYLMNRRLE